MKIKQIFFVMICLVLSMGSSYAATIDELGKTTVCLRGYLKSYEMKGDRKYEVWLKDIENQESQPKLIPNNGTGFLVSHHKRSYLVTAAHIAEGISNKAKILWNTASGKGKHFSYEELQKGIPSSKWFFHSSADIAVHPFVFTEKSEHILVPDEMFMTENEVIPLGTKVYVLGFPLNLGVTDILSPISKKAEIASWKTTIDYPELQPNLKFILLDEGLAGGYSGAPVFTSPEPQMRNNTIMLGGIQPKLIGIQCRTTTNKIGSQLSLVVPISYLNEIFTSNDFKEYENKRSIK